ncbi:MAG: DUF547 domain-containing protein [Magnetococcales bacterium]|nr:DUF547 domain-containing protein [Magnetococcales bacterium]
MSNRPLHIFIILMAFGLLYPPLLRSDEPDWTHYASILDKHITQQRKQGVTLAWLDYTAIKVDQDYIKSLETLENFPVERLASDEEKIAFYINAYNILAIKMVLDHWPVKSIKDVGSWFNPVWKKTAGTISEKKTTLNEIEHNILRSMGEPRIHMAIVCASLSCPDLRREPYSAANLDAQLDEQVKQFFNNQDKGLEVSKSSLRTSKILDWFSEDFGNPLEFIRKYRPEITKNATITGYLNYNWSLNGK